MFVNTELLNRKYNEIMEKNEKAIKDAQNNRQRNIDILVNALRNSNGMNESDMQKLINTDIKPYLNFLKRDNTIVERNSKYYIH